MSKRTRCHFCGHRLAHKRFGIELPPLKAHIFDLIMAGGDEGVASAELIKSIRGAPELRLRTLNVHVNQINVMLAPAGWTIIGRDWRKYLIKLEKKPKKKGLATRVKD